jgi:DHA2 family multidrug resistance protein
MFTSVFLTPVIAQRLLGFTPTQTGLMLLPSAIIAIVALTGSGKLIQKGLSPIFVVAAGFVCFIYLTGACKRLILIHQPMIYDQPDIQGYSDGIFNCDANHAGYIIALTGRYSTRCSINNMMRQLGGAFGISAVDNRYYVTKANKML